MRADFLNVCLFATAMRAASHHRDNDEQYESNECDDDPNLDRHEQKADERNKLAHQCNEENDERDDSAERDLKILEKLTWFFLYCNYFQTP